MKKLNLAFIATALMLSFGCQKEIESTDQQPNQEVEVQEKFACTPQSTTYKFDDPNPNINWGYGPTDLGSIVTPDIGNIACYPDIFVTSDYGTFSTLWDMVYSGAPQSVIINYIQNNYNVLSSYIDPCILYLITNDNFEFYMYNYTNVQGVEYMGIKELYGPPSTIYWMYELYYI